MGEREVLPVREKYEGADRTVGGRLTSLSKRGGKRPRGLSEGSF
jgi:hypothetical protein